jgi:hypothetical protein
VAGLRYDENLDRIEQAIDENAQITANILRDTGAIFKETIPALEHPQQWHNLASDFDHSVARGCIRALYRDWTSAGDLERTKSHRLVLDVIRSEHAKYCKSAATESTGEITKPMSLQQQQPLRILCPGAGLGRLVHSMHELGCSVEWNDVSCHMLLACLSTLQSSTRAVGQSPPLKIHPWAMSFSNHRARAGQVASYKVPDIELAPMAVHCLPDLSEADLTQPQISFRLASFDDIYAQPAWKHTFDGLTTCYFIDTAKNFLGYVNAAWNCIRPGGFWVNVGPLLWNSEENGPAGEGQADGDGQNDWMHQGAIACQGQGQQRAAQLLHNDSSSAKPSPAVPSLEFTADEVLDILRAKGFVIEQAWSNIAASTYIGNPDSMLQYKYRMAFWLARKPVSSREHCAS